MILVGVDKVVTAMNCYLLKQEDKKLIYRRQTLEKKATLDRA
jgi:hypothetical protein